MGVLWPVKRASVTAKVSITLKRLEELEGTVRVGLSSFMAVGMALIEIRETKGYRLRGHRFFKDYCQEVFGFTARHGRRMMQSARVAKAVKAATGEWIDTESAALALIPVSDSPPLIAAVVERLSKHKQRLGRASGILLEDIVSDVVKHDKVRTRRPMKARPRVDVIVAGSDLCPSCGKRPGSYVRRGELWQCGLCRTVVNLGVRWPDSAVRSGFCPRCQMAFGEENPQASGQVFCTYCAEEVVDGQPLARDR